MAALAGGIVKKIVLTGGPCGGKSTVQTLLSDVFSNMGWKVFRVPETATVLLSGGVNFAELTKDQAFQFQKDLLLSMMSIEETFFNLASSECAKGQRVIVICDRGTMDASAYIDKSEWNNLIADIDCSEVQIRDERYDYVVHLVTAALGAEEFYGNDTNNTRSENVELAKSLDQLCQNAWIGHPYFDVIDNSTPFDEKCNLVIGAILRRLGLEDRRFGKNISKFKFLVSEEFRPFDHGDFHVSFQDFSVEHVFLADENHTRIRQRTQDGVSHFNLTSPQINGVGEIRRTLSGREYDILKRQADPSRVAIVKKRRCFLWDNRYYQLDLFLSPPKYSGLLILEAYSQSQMDILPPFIPVRQHITGDPAFTMLNISLK